MLKILDNKDFDRVFNIMEKSFPEDEFRPYDEQKALLDKDEYKIYTWQENDKICAFIALWEFHNILFIEHFAVDPDFRNGGIGSKILAEISSLTKKQICLEVEPPDDEITIRRVEFYKRCGFFLNEYPYMQPAISKGKREVPLMIMTYGKKITRMKFNDIKFVLYTNVYKISL
ncbi:MAG: GNAT family N-acetyltransferase [Clostridia bacterium]|nr:GNAT family N-acetyltransferase [Clostridia bacterium]